MPRATAATGNDWASSNMQSLGFPPGPEPRVHHQKAQSFGLVLVVFFPVVQKSVENLVHCAEEV